MGKLRFRAVVAIAGVAGVALLGSISPAHAVSSEQATATDVVAQSDDAGYVVVDRGDAVEVGEGMFYPTGPVSDDTLIVIAEPDGSLPGSLTEADLQSIAAGGEGGQTYAAKASYGWSATATAWSINGNKPSFIGLNDTTKAPYYFATNGNTTAMGDGMGYYRGYNGSTFGVWSKWYRIGTSGKAGKSNTVPWGNVAANRQFRAQCVTTPGPVCGGGWS